MKNISTTSTLLGLLIGVVVTGVYFTLVQPRTLSYRHTGSDMKGDSFMKDDMGMHGTMNHMMSGLTGKTGDAFDKAFISEMIEHHKGAVEMAQAVLKNSKRQELLKLAHDIISAQTGEIKMMETWQQTWFK